MFALQRFIKKKKQELETIQTKKVEIKKFLKIFPELKIANPQMQ